MKKLKRITILSSLLLLSFQSMAQQDSLSIKYSEEVLEVPKNKNIKWVPRRKGHFNMENFQSILKIGTPLVEFFFELGNNSETYTFFDLNYEKKLPKTQLSIEVRMRSSVNSHGIPHFYKRSSESNLQSRSYRTNLVTVDLFFRYYLFKNRAIADEKSGNNLYGLYLMGGALNLAAWQKERKVTYDINIGSHIPFRETVKKGITSGSFRVITGMGYQVKFLKNGFVDLKLGYSKFIEKSLYSTGGLFGPIEGLNKGGIFGSIYADLTAGYLIFRKTK